MIKEWAVAIIAAAFFGKKYQHLDHNPSTTNL
jgi:hypothetical protein